VRPARNIAFAFTAACLLLALVTLLAPTSSTFSAGTTSSTVDCGSPAFPRSQVDVDSPDDAANCVGQTSASLALWSVVLGALGLGAIAITSQGASTRGGGRRAAKQVGS
jgi:hypothetical protein